MGANILLPGFLDDNLTIVILGNTNLAGTHRMGASWFPGVEGGMRGLARHPRPA